MQDVDRTRKHGAWWRLMVGSVLTAVFTLGVLAPQPASAQFPARFYWKSLEGGHAVPLIVESINGNTNPFDAGHTVTPGADFEATMAMTGYAHTFSLGDRAATAAIILPMGRISGDVTLAGRTIHQSASGFGDPMLELDVNLIGPPVQKLIPDVMRYEPGFSVDLVTDVAVPIGEYDSTQSLNIGQNRWYGRVGLPVTWQLGQWVPGKRTTLELLPAVWLFGNNNDYVGQTLKTDPMFQLDAHLSHDISEHAWGSLDMSWWNGGAGTINGVAGQDLNNLGVGLTLGYEVNENLNLTFGYKSTINDSAPTDPKMDGFMFTLVYGWHPDIEGMKRLEESK